MDRTLGKGSDEPGIHVRLNVVESRGKYLTGKDAQRYSTSGKTRCPYVTGQARRSAPGTGEPEAIPPPASNLLDQRLTTTVVTGLGDANSPAEHQLAAQHMAPTLGMAPPPRQEERP